MIYITGDTHADFHRLCAGRFHEQTLMDRDDMLIILGDFGGVWYDCHEERYWLNWFSKSSFTICFVDGNHENFDRLLGDEFPVVEFHGGKAKQIRDNIFYLMRGEIFDFEGKKFFAMGGASSHDIQDGIIDPENFDTPRDAWREIKKWHDLGKMFRVKGVSWWPQEIPSDDEFRHAEETLRKNNMRVDYVLSHCLPSSVNAVVGYHDTDKLTDWFQKMVDSGLQFDAWFSGHLHMEKFGILGKYNILYEKIERIL